MKKLKQVEVVVEKSVSEDDEKKDSRLSKSQLTSSASSESDYIENPSD